MDDGCCGEPDKAGCIPKATGPAWECEIEELRGDLVDAKGQAMTEALELWKRNPVELNVSLRS